MPCRKLLEPLTGWFLLCCCLVNGLPLEVDECGDEKHETCALYALQQRAHQQSVVENTENFTTPFRMLKNSLSGRCLAIAGPGVVGNMLMLLDCASTIERIRQFRLSQGHLVTLGEGEVPLCVLMEGDSLKLDKCENDLGGWVFSKSYFRSYGWVKQGKKCLGVQGSMSKQVGALVVAESCSYLPLSDQRWFWTDDLK